MQQKGAMTYSLINSGGRADNGVPLGMTELMEADKKLRRFVGRKAGGKSRFDRRY